MTKDGKNNVNGIAGVDNNLSGVEVRIRDLEGRLKAYRQSLSEIYELFDQKIEELSLIRRVGDSIRTPFDIKTLCRTILEAVVQEIDVERAALMLVDDDRRNLWLRARYDASLDSVVYFSEETSCARGPVLFDSQGDSANTPILLSSANPELDPASDDDGELISLVLLPLVARRRMTGLLSLTRPVDYPFNDNDVRVLTIIADHAATALANVRLFDELTDANEKLRLSENEARRTSLYLENILETANDVILTLDDAGVIGFVNKKAEAWGYSKSDLIGKPVAELLFEGDLEQLPEILKENIQSLELQIKARDGGKRDVLISTSVLEAAGGADDKDSVHIVLGRDITERKQLLNQLFHSEKLASIGILAAGVAHEIGNPLSAISGYTQILQSGGVSDQDAAEYLAAIEEQSNRIQRIIKDLLNYSRPSAGRRTRVNISREIPQIMNMLTAQQAFRHMTIDYTFNNEELTLDVDRDQLAQVLVNIAINSAQASPEGVVLTIGARSVGDMVEISMKDDGPGIPGELVNRVFDPFFTTKPAGKGTGLGLSICHRIIDSYGGLITAVSEPGEGTEFTIALPSVKTVPEG